MWVAALVCFSYDTATYFHSMSIYICLITSAAKLLNKPTLTLEAVDLCFVYFNYHYIFK